MKRSRWISLCFLGIASVGLGGCGQTLEQALAPDPETKTWSGTSPTKPPATPQGAESPQPTDQNSAGRSEAELIQVTPQSFADSADAPANLQTYVADLARLEVLNPVGETPDNEPLFSPNQPIKRSTFARWLIQTSNRFYRDRPTRQFRVASKDASTQLYTDVPKDHPDFAYIQGLAEAGYLPSSLTGDTDVKAFNPDANLTRETLLRWKVPIDQQKLLPTVTTAKIQETWGFKDSSQVSGDAASAVVADHANQELSNVRRLIGASLLLQPKKAVTRAEAAAALWYFGVDGEGISAKDVLRAEAQSKAAEQNAPPPESSQTPNPSDPSSTPNSQNSPPPPSPNPNTDPSLGN